MSNFKDVKPLTPNMIELLMDCHEREIMKQMPYDAGEGKHIRGLIMRQLVAPKIYRRKDGKDVVCVFTTQLGREYLAKLI